MLARVVNDDAGCLKLHGAWSTIASKLAPTGIGRDIIGIDSHHQLNEVLIKIVRRNISSIPNNYTPWSTRS